MDVPIPKGVSAWLCDRDAAHTAGKILQPKKKKVLTAGRYQT